MQKFKDLIKSSPFFFLLKPILITYWRLNGRKLPPPHIVKQKVLKEYAKKYSLSTLIETGTYKGDMIKALANEFKNIYSIELDQALYDAAVQKFATANHVKVIQGDSAEQLKKLLENIQEKCLFWLDGHYSGGITAMGSVESPITAELESIFSHNIKDHVVLIDDARNFIGEGGYPVYSDLEKFVKAAGNGLVMENIDDIIRIHKA